MTVLAQGLFDGQIAPHINHFLEVSLHLIMQPWWNPPIAFFDWFGPFFQGDLVFYNWGSSQIKIVFIKDIHILP